jgi:hypothetical protein
MNGDVNAPVPRKCSAPAGPVGTQVNNDTKGKGKVPKAFISPATHFTPIVLEAETGYFKQREATKPNTTAVSKKEPEKISGLYKKNDSATMDRNKIVAEKLKELKKQLMMNQPPPHMVDDLENESSFETGPSGSRSHPNSRVTSPMEVKKCLSPPETELRAATVREVPVPAVRKTLKEKGEKKDTVIPKAITPSGSAEEATKTNQNVPAKMVNSYPLQPNIDLSTVAHLQDPKTGIVYAMIPVTNPVLPVPEPEKQLPTGSKPAVTSRREAHSKKEPQNHHTSTSSDEESPCYQTRRRRPERKRVTKPDSKDKVSAKPKQKILEVKPEPQRRSRGTCRDSVPVPALVETSKKVTRERDTSRSRIPLPRERAKSQERLTDISRQRGERSQYPPISGKTRPEFKRSQSEKDLKSFHVHGDIDIGTPVGASTDFDITDISLSAIDSPNEQPSKNDVDPLEQVVPDLNSSFEDHEAQFELEAEIMQQQGEVVHGAVAAISPIVPQSPSPPLSKDSGVSGLILKSNGGAVYPSLMDRLLNSDAMRRHEVLRKVVLLIREEFAFDGYMENGVEDLAMGKSMLKIQICGFPQFFSVGVPDSLKKYFFNKSTLLSHFNLLIRP